jgi:hypothetical protein
MKEIVDALVACVTSAPEEKRNALAQALEDFAEEFPHSWRNIQPGALRRLLSEVSEACDARVEI